ncbi:MAG: hypothetical protein U0746_19435 [Gemmataceae bacterium]
MNDAEAGALLQEIRAMLARQERVLEEHCARQEQSLAEHRALAKESAERFLARLREEYDEVNAKSQEAYNGYLAECRRDYRWQNLYWYINLFVTVFFAAAVGARWGR